LVTLQCYDFFLSKKGNIERASTDDASGFINLTLFGLNSCAALKAASGVLRLETSCCLK